MTKEAHTPDDVVTFWKDLSKDQQVWAYVRVSSKSQEDNESFEVQEQDILAYCERAGLQKPVIIREVASATEPLFDFRLRGREDQAEPDSSPRPVFFNLLSLITDTPPGTGALRKHFVFWKLDRLARNDMDQELILRALWKGKVSVHSTFASEAEMLVEGSSVADPQRDFFRKIMGAAAAYEAQMIRVRLDAGKRMKASRGGFTGGRPPFGYRSHNKEMVIEHYEARIVRLVFRLHKEYGLNQTKIAEWIEDRKDPKDGRHYHPAMIGRILRREALYRGTYTDQFGEDHLRADLDILNNEDLDHGPENKRFASPY